MNNNEKREQIEKLYEFLGTKFGQKFRENESLQVAKEVCWGRIQELESQLRGGRPSQPPITIDQPAFAIALVLDSGEIDKNRAKDELSKLPEFKDVSERTLERRLKEMLPRAKKFNKFQRYVEEILRNQDKN